MVSSEISSSDPSAYTLFHIEKIIFNYENQFLREKWKHLGFLLQFFSNYFQNLAFFLNSDDFVGKITSKSLRLYPVFIQKKI